VTPFLSLDTIFKTLIQSLRFQQEQMNKKIIPRLPDWPTKKTRLDQN